MACENVYRDVCGLHLSYIFQEAVVREALTYKPKPGDVFVVSFPKSGSTWMQQIVYAIYNDGAKPESSLDWRQWRRCHDLEQSRHTYLSVTCLTLRKPSTSSWPETRTDCCVSFYHHTRAFPAYHFAEGSFDTFLNAFLDGKVGFGDYFDQLLSWYDHIDDDNVLFVTYEKLKSHTRETVIKIADFLGDRYGDKLRNQPEILQNILEHHKCEDHGDFQR
ncbi:hypothetical protein MTO96_019269 [Rhipicephalus appendiculatus]